MKRLMRFLLWIVVALAPSCAYAQNAGNDDPSFNDNIGILSMGAPLNPMARYTSFGLGVTFGAGYNFTRRQAVVGEFMWNWLYTTDGALQPVRVALQSPNIGGHGTLITVGANYRYEIRGNVFGTYFIGGPGWYRRSAELSKPIPTGTACVNPLPTWWGFGCTPGITTTNLTIVHSSSNALGFNGGIGFTIRVGDAPYRFYVESRYHYAPTKNINTQIVTVVVGFRY